MCPTLRTESTKATTSDCNDMRLRRMSTESLENRHAQGSSSYKKLRSHTDIQIGRKMKTDQQSPLLLLVCASGICGCYLYFGIIQERVFSKGSSSNAIQQVGSITTFMLVLSCITNVIVATLWIYAEKKFQKRDSDSLKQQKPKPLNHPLLLTAAFAFFAAMTASNEALGFVSYPTAVLAKSSKLIPTMIVGFLLERKTFLKAEWISAALITGGIIMFNLSRMDASGKGKRDDDADSSYGLFLLIFSLGMDGVLGSCQNFIKKESAKSRYRSPIALESMLWINAYAFVFLLPLSISSGQFANGMKLLQNSNSESMNEKNSLLWSIALMNFTAAVGQVFIFFTVQLFSPLICTTITTTRKFFTILLSVWKFGHRFTSVQWISITMVFGGLYMAIVSKFTVQSKNNQEESQPPQSVEKKMD